MSSKRLILVRHGETQSTLEGRFCGADDPPLTTRGFACAHALKHDRRLRAPDLLLSSPARRALETARPLAQRIQRPIVQIPALAETRFGLWEGMRPHDVHATEAYRAWAQDPASCAPPEGEQGLTVQLRAVDALAARLAGADDIAVFSHKGTIRLIYCYFLNLPASDYRRLPDVPPASITEIWLDGQRVSRSVLGDVTHLSGIRDADQHDDSPEHASAAVGTTLDEPRAARSLQRGRQRSGWQCCGERASCGT